MLLDYGTYPATTTTKSGVCQALVHGPLQYGGLEIPHLYMEELVAHAHTILWCGLDKDNPTGHLLHVTGKVFQLEVGYSGELLTAPLILVDNVTNL